MSRVPLASGRPPSMVVEIASSSLRVSSGTSYRPSRDCGAPQENSNEATAGRASVVAPPPPHHNIPTLNEGSARKADEGATSRKLGPNQPNRGDARRSLNYSTKSSQTQDSQKLIAELRREIHDLRQEAMGQEARGQIPAKERPTKKTHASKRQNPEYPTHTRSSRNEDFSETSSSQSESREIEKAKLSERYTAPHFKMYNGRTNPVTHIGHYQQSMALSRHNDPLMCRLFPSSLREVAMRWFNQLGTRTIYSWDQMAEAFMAQFITNSRKRKEMGALLTMKLEDKETIKDYSTKFWETYNDIEACGEEVTIITFKMGLPTDSGLRQSLIKHPPRDVGKLIHKIDQFFRVEEDGRRTPPDQTIAQPKVVTTKPAARIGNTTKNLPTPTNFVAPTFRAFETVFKEPIYKVLEKIKKEPKDIEQVISFSNSELKDVQLPHNDPLVITLRIGNYDVQRVLIDQRSFAEVMYQDLYVKLGLGEAELSSFTSPIFGFSGEPTVPLGKTILPVLAGPINLQTKFIVVKASSPYNAIMGHDWLHRMKAIPTILHQKLRFPTKEGVMELNGDQVTAKQCVLAAVKRKGTAEILISNRDVFAWLVYNAPGVSPDLACHSLNIGPEHRPIVQKRRKLAPERATIVLEEVERLLASRAIREVQYLVWLSNTVVVKKKNGKWRVCIDFTDLNKTCPKDPFPLPRIDQLVDSASGHSRLSFLDAFQGYYQIPMNPTDQEKTAFITPRGTYCYKVMSFGLKNVGATYQRMVTKMFGHMIGKTVEVYIDEMLVKSLREENDLADLLQVFDILRKSHLRLNASNCTFDVRSGKFLGHVVSRRGIETNPDQIAALIDLAEPRNIRESRLTYQLLHAFQFQILGEPLFLYLAVSDHAVSAVLVRELGQEHKPVFFVSKAMDETKLRYLPLEKAALALLQATKKLPHYFQSSTVTVLNDLPLKMLLQRSNFTGRITRWGVYLGSLRIEYKPRTAIKGQVLAEFLVEFQYDPSNPFLLIPAETQLGLDTRRWELFVDGASNSKGSGARIVLVSLEGLILEQAVRLKFSASNNEAEYEALLIGLKTAKKTWDERMSAYLTVARTLLAEFDSTHVAQIGREHNSHADILAKLAMALELDIQRTVCIETLDQPSFQNQEVSVCSISSQPSWMDPILSYLKDNKLPEDKKEARMIKHKAPRYWVSKEGLLYSHTGRRSLVHRAISQGYWWPYMQADALKYVRECDKCQRAPSSGSRKQEILDCRNRLFYKIDNGTQFESRLFKGFCSELGIRNFFSSPGYPQSNGQAEVSNKVILNGIKRKLEAAEGKWVKELPSILWTYRTTVRKSTNETPFALAFNVEAIIPLEIGMPTT
uniref:RNA-directed DNA polymerase n=1 Tax=Fagus sylvatica TaxID=28930 RepID=A0A2N9GAT2_FAGSY